MHINSAPPFKKRGDSGTAIQALFQREVPEAMKERFFATFTTTCYSTIPVTMFLNGVLSQIMDLFLLILANGIMVMIITTAFLFIPRVETYATTAKQSMDFS